MPTNTGTVRRMTGRLVPALLAVMLSLVAVGMLIATIFLAWLEIMSAPLATLSTAAVLALIAGSLVAISRLQRKRHSRSAKTGGLMPALSLIAGQKPLAALAFATVLGVVNEVTTKNGKAQHRRE